MMTKKIFWDKGHGGTDSGAVGNGLKEKEVVRKIVEYAMEYLDEHYTGFEQKTSRKGDQTLSLDQRTDAANKWGADVFISAHNNAANQKAKGFETFIHPNGSSATVALQNVMHSEILKAMRKFDSTIIDRGNKKANYHVLRETKMPAILTENLFIDSGDGKHLKDEKFIKAVGEAHALGVAKYLGLKTKPKVEKASTTDKLYRVQVGAFKDISNARELAAELKKKGYDTVIV